MTTSHTAPLARQAWYYPDGSGMLHQPAVAQGAPTGLRTTCRGGRTAGRTPCRSPRATRRDVGVVHSLAAARGASERDAGHDAGMDISHLTLNAYLDEWLGLLRIRIQPTTLRSYADMIDA